MSPKLIFADEAALFRRLDADVKEEIMALAVQGTRKKKTKRPHTKAERHESLQLWSMAALPLLLVFVFSYIPIYGIAIAFQDYVPGIPILFSKQIHWTGFEHFSKFIQSIYFSRLLKNTVWLSLLQLLFGFWVPIVFALFLNEIHHRRYKKLIQTASYMPYFISNVVVVGMVLSFLQPTGLINVLITLGGGRAEAWITKPDAFPWIYTLINVWKSFGFNSILYMSTLASIDSAIYESARIDGAKRMQIMRYITLPSLKPTIAILLILQVGSLLSSNSDLILLLYTSSTYRTADVFGTYIYRLGIQGGQFSYTTAIGLMLSLVNFLLVFIANKSSDRLTGYAMW